MDLPRFVKGQDDRDKRPRAVAGGADVVLFEGWRVGVRHPNFFAMSRLLDALVHVSVDLEAALSELYRQKKEFADRDMAACGTNM